MKDNLNEYNTLDHRIFRSDSKLNSKEINDLLGIKVNIDRNSHKSSVKEGFTSQLDKILKFAVITLVLSSIALLSSMYQLKIGPFHESEVYATTKAK